MRLQRATAWLAAGDRIADSLVYQSIIPILPSSKILMEDDSRDWISQENKHRLIIAGAKQV